MGKSGSDKLMAQGFRGWSIAAATVGALLLVYVLLRPGAAPSAHRAELTEEQREKWEPSSENCNALGHKYAGAAAPSEGRRVLVTGAAGFIGSHVAKHCLKLGMYTVAVDDLSGGFLENLPQGVEFFLVDLKNASALGRLFRDHGPFDYVYHIAAYAAEGLSHFIRSYNYRNNLVGSIELLNQAIKHKTKTFVFTSSIAIYGSHPKLPLTERGSVAQPEDPYGISKLAMELDLKAAHEMYGMNYIIYRPHNVYGPHQNIADKYRNVIGIFMNNILNGKKMTIFGDGKQTRCFSYVDDVAPMIARGPLIKEAYNDVFNVGADHPSTLNELAYLVGKAMNVSEKDAHPVHLDSRLEVEHAQAWHAKLRCMFDPPAPMKLSKGLRETAQWVVQKTKGFQAVEFEAVEVKAKMPRSWVRPDLQQHDEIFHTVAQNPRAGDLSTVKYP